jgi:hypothetical protein
VTILRAAMIIGSGSASFEILRYLVDRLPVIITPRWVHTPFQPIAIRNVLTYLVRCLEEPGTLGQMLDIGGPEILTYRDMMRMYAEEAGLARRWIIPVPVLTPRLSSYWIHVVTPVPAAIARPLAEGLANPVICRETRIRTLIPLDLLTPREAVRRALSLVRQGRPETHWTDAGLLPGDPEWAGGTLLRDDRRLMVHASQEQVWRAIAGIGGERGWYQLDWIWTVRGVLDRFMGGVGLRRGRRHPDELAPGDALDFWRVLEVEPGRRLRLGAEMRLPGIATLQWRLQEQTPGEVLVVQQVRFRPRGLAGILYWYAVSPLHGIVFQGLLRGIARQASRA